MVSSGEQPVFTARSHDLDTGIEGSPYDEAYAVNPPTFQDSLRCQMEILYTERFGTDYKTIAHGVASAP